MRSPFKLLILTLFLSLMIHLLFFTGISLIRIIPPEDHEAIQVELFPEGQIRDALTRDKKSIVRQALVPEKLKVPKDETLARFLSEHDQRVREETQAAQKGMTANRDNQPLSEQTLAKSSSSSKPMPKSEDGYQEFNIGEQLREMSQFENGSSTVGEVLPQDVKIGSFTALNTDRYLYYSFYARMEERIRHPWESRVQFLINSMDRATAIAASRRPWTTHLEFLLNPKGELVKALLIKESGIPAFDQAAIAAFQEARIFPNPPQGMIQEDGFIHVKFGFTVNFNPPMHAGQ